MRLAVANTIKFIKESKPGKPGGDMAGGSSACADGGQEGVRIWLSRGG